MHILLTCWLFNIKQVGKMGSHTGAEFRCHWADTHQCRMAADTITRVFTCVLYYLYTAVFCQMWQSNSRFPLKRGLLTAADPIFSKTVTLECSGSQVWTQAVQTPSRWVYSLAYLGWWTSSSVNWEVLVTLEVSKLSTAYRKGLEVGFRV